MSSIRLPRKDVVNLRSPTNNPFLPGSDRVPEVWAGRAEELADWSEIVRPRRVSGLYERGRAYLGEFGIGKSVLVNRIAADAAADGDWVPERVRVAVAADPLRLLAEALHDFVQTRSLGARIGRRSADLLKRVEEITLPAIGGGVRLRSTPPDANAYRAVRQLLIEVAHLARQEDRALVVRIDEVQNIARPGPLSQLLTVLGDALEVVEPERDAAGITRERALPVVVYLSGLPDFDRHVGESGATFSRRFRTVELEPLSTGDLRAALAAFEGDGWPVLTSDGPASVHMAPEAIATVVESCLGDPFLFQLAGEAAWNAGTGAVITSEEADRGWATARREVTRYVEGRLEGLTDLQLAFLRAAAALQDDQPPSVTAVARELGRRSASEVASTARSLEQEHTLIRRRAGQITFRSGAVAAYLRGDWP